MIGMRALVQSKETQLFLGQDQDWTQERSQAKDFGSAAEALDYCLKNQIRQIRIVLDFGNAEYDLSFDVKDTS